MAYQKKYYFSFKDIRLTERTHLVELWQNTETVLTAEEIKGHMNPFSVEMPEIDHKFQVVRGCGCQINLLSETDMKFFTGLYHVNPTDFMVKHYIDGVINFYGYLNAEMMSEPYDIDFNYQVSLTGNDGFSLMDRFSFIQLDESNYTGVKSKFELLQIIFAKIGLPFVEYRIALATTFTGYSGDTDSSILHESYVDCANFYDEDDKPMTLREVVESILAPYGVHIRAESGNIYITDIHSLASLTDVVYKRFTMSTGAYAGFIAIPNIKAVSDIGYLGTGQQIERSGGVNRQVVSYSPYPYKTILDESLTNLEEFETVPSTFSIKDGYHYKTLLGNDFWAVSAGTFEQSYFTDEDKSNIYIRWARATTNTKVASLLQMPVVAITGSHITPVADRSGVYSGRYRLKFYDGVSLLISGTMLVKTRTNPYDETQTNKNINIINLNIVVKIGSRYLNQQGLWTTTPAKFFVTTMLEDRSVLTDQFVKLGSGGEGFKLNVGNFNEEITLNGALEIEIWSEFQSYTTTNSGLVTNSTDIKEIWLEELSVKLITFDGNEIPDTDKEYIGLLDRTFQNEGEKIELTCGTDTQFADRGKILQFNGTDYSDILEWTRNSQSFKIEELLLGSVSSNYRAGFVTLSNMKLKNSFSLQNILTDTFITKSVMIPDSDPPEYTQELSKMMVKSAKINYQDNVVECSLEEILPDELIIVKDATVT